MAAALGAACSHGDPNAPSGETEGDQANERRVATGELAPGPRIIGTVPSVLEEATRGAAGGKPGYALPDSEGHPIALDTTDYYFDGNALSMTGGARVDADATFILKGNATDLYGWIVLPGSDVAYEYTTNARGEVVVVKVPVTKIYPVCDDDTTGDSTPPELAPMAPRGRALDPPHVGPYNGQDTTKLQSRPGAKKVLFMDMAVLTLDKAELWKAWQTVASAYSAFDVNVTTDKAVYDAAGVTNSGKGCYNNATGRSSCGVNAFGTTRCCTIYNKGNGYYEGTTSAHELGHLMGLSHDGGEPGGAYFAGFSAYKWCPIMGSNIPKTDWGDQALFQWSKGEYASATQKQDDLAILTKNLPYRPDDIPVSRALTIQAGDVSSDWNRGQIAHSADSDTFTFRVGSMGGHATLNVDRLEFVGGAYLDVDAQLLDSAGAKIAQSNEKVARSAWFDLDLTPGDYRLVVAGGAEGTPANGFSKYSSLGFYGISGKITGVIDTGGTGGSAGAAGSAGAGGVAGAGGSAGASDPGGAAGSAGSGGSSAGSGGSSGAGGTTGGTAGNAGTGGAGGSGGSGTTGGTAGTGASGSGGAGGGSGNGGVPGAGADGGMRDGGQAASSAAGSGGAVGGSNGGGDGEASDRQGCSCSTPAAPTRLSSLWLLAAATAWAAARRRPRGARW